MSDVTSILSQIDSGDPKAADQLLPLVYDELRKLAAAKLAQEKPGQTLQATALVHEAYLRLLGKPGDRGQDTGNSEPATSGAERSPVSCPLSPAFDSRGHFFAAAAEAMRRILVEGARRKKAVKHGGGHRRVETEPADSIDSPSPLDLLALDEALTKLTEENPLHAELVKLRFFAGLSMSEAAEALGISLATAERHWAFARIWLYAELSEERREKSREG